MTIDRVIPPARERHALRELCAIGMTAPASLPIAQDRKLLLFWGSFVRAFSARRAALTRARIIAGSIDQKDHWKR